MRAYFATMARASAKVVASGRVGPDATADRSSPGTSEMTSDTTRAGYAAAANFPPLIADKCLRSVFISEIGAPDFKSAALTACLSASVIPGDGKLKSAEPPPDINATTMSSFVKLRTNANIRVAACSLAASGTGCAASMTSIYLVGTL